jgi:hypothetical protein
MKNIFWAIALYALTLSSASAPVQTNAHQSIDPCQTSSVITLADLSMSGCGLSTADRGLALTLLTIGPMHFSQDYFLWSPANVYAEIPMVSGAGYYDYEWYLDGTFQQMSSYNHEFTFYGCGSHYLSVRALTSSGWTDFAHGYFYVAC